MKLFKGYNDHELLYMIKANHDEKALDILFDKYKFLIGKKISGFNVFSCDRDDFMQEGLILLHKAIWIYDTKYNKTFTKFFEVILERRFINLLNQNRRYREMTQAFGEQVKEYSHDVLEEYVFTYAVDAIKSDLKSDLEKTVYEAHFVRFISVKEIVLTYGFTTRQVYNAIYRIKEKLK